LRGYKLLLLLHDSMFSRRYEKIVHVFWVVTNSQTSIRRNRPSLFSCWWLC
jgi:hypothetical protein